MSTISPSPNSTPSSPPPSSSSAPPPSTTAPPPSTTTPPPSTTAPPPSVTSPEATSPPTVAAPPPMAAPPPQSPAVPPPSTTPSTPPPVTTAPPPVSPPVVGSPPPITPAAPPPSSPPPPPPADPPTVSNPPPAVPATPPASPPPPQPADPPANSPPPPVPRSPPPPESSPPPPTAQPPTSSSPPPPPSSTPPENSPPPPSVPRAPPPAVRSPPPPATADPPTNSPPPPPVAKPPANSPPSPPSPPLTSPPSPPSSSPPASLPSPVPPGAPPNTNNSTTNASDSSGLSSGNGGGIGTAGTAAIGVGVAFILLFAIGAAFWCLWKRKKKGSGPNGGHILPTSMGSASPKSDSGLLTVGKSGTNARTESGSMGDFVYSPNEPGGMGNSRSLFSYEELFAATDGFSAHNILGEGGFGCVYKGHLLDGRVVAVKQLKIDASQGEREFRAEVEIISRIHHRHLVSLVGFCISDHRRLLIYDYVSNNTLYFHLHEEGRPVLDWPRRVKIAVGSARGLAYLHEDCHPRIIHRDIKSSNILIDENFEAQVCDFGLAKLCQDFNTHISTRVMGTFGYMAPEYASSGKLTEKSDVFSFGVVLLELITGRKPVDTSQPIGEESLVEWGRPLLAHAIETEQFDELVDPRLGDNFVDSEMIRLIEVAAACVRHSSEKRPQMGQVVRAFDTLATSDLTNGMKVGESQIYNSAQQSEEIRWFRRMAFGSQNFSTDFFSQNTNSHIQNTNSHS